ncbi:hypothetical protein VNO77_06386 [Canavalia gladiata]|uniref:Uncharacterized protein n=1 Tax=Canavalia gladiata TaxID=3824 RepID=A0AAN9MC29_CANGL
MRHFVEHLCHNPYGSTTSSTTPQHQFDSSGTCSVCDCVPLFRPFDPSLCLQPEELCEFKEVSPGYAACLKKIRKRRFRSLFPHCLLHRRNLRQPPSGPPPGHGLQHLFRLHRCGLPWAQHDLFACFNIGLCAKLVKLVPQANQDQFLLLAGEFLPLHSSLLIPSVLNSSKRQ